MYHAIRHARKMHLESKDVASKIDSEFMWLEIIERMKRACRSLSMLGTAVGDATPVLLTELSNYYNEVKDNFRKNLAAMIVKKAVQHKCNVIVLEELEKNSIATSLNPSRKNALTALWSAKAIMDSIKNVADWFGIQIVEVSESQTSRVHYETQTYGHRDGDTLYYVEGGQLNEVHADENAAKNIALKAVSRHTSTTQVNLAALRKRTSEDEGGKRTKGLLSYHFKTLDAAKKSFSGFGDDVEYIYLNAGKWISDTDRWALDESIKSMVAAKYPKTK
jgi:IS605 OrfB family transposase